MVTKQDCIVHEAFMIVPGIFEMPIDWRISHKSARENKISERRIEKMTK
jgi:hypothetical protein